MESAMSESEKPPTPDEEKQAAEMARALGEAEDRAAVGLIRAAAGHEPALGELRARAIARAAVEAARAAASTSAASTATASATPAAATTERTGPSATRAGRPIAVLRLRRVLA